MKVYDVETDVREGIAVALEPYPHIVLGQGGNKRATWVALGKRDAGAIVVQRSLDDVPAQCPACSSRDMYSRGEIDRQGWRWAFCCRSCDKGRMSIDEWIGPHVLDVGIVALKDAEGGKYLIVAPRNSEDNRALVLWRVASGYRGSASISADRFVTVIASDSSWHSGAGALGSTAEMLAVLKPGQSLRAERSGRTVQNPRAVLVYDGQNITVTFGGEELNAVLADEPEGDYV